MIPYRKYLEQTARQMILIHRAETLIRIVLRTIVRVIKVKHAGLFVKERESGDFVMKISRKLQGTKLPVGFIKINKENPLVRYFLDKKINLFKEAIVLDKVSNWLRSKRIKKDSELFEFFKNLKFTLELYQAKVCIPGFFQRELLGILFLGEKINRKKFKDEEIKFLSVLSSDVVMALKNAWLIEDLNFQIEKNRKLLLTTVSALVNTVEAKDRYTRSHTEKVEEVAVNIAKNLEIELENKEEFLEEVRIAALLHDIGKIGIPENILNKPTSLTFEEKKIIEQHVLFGENILGQIQEFKEIVLGVKYHHERWDGKGYPCGLKAEEIPLIAAIISLADAFDAMIRDRPYRKALSFKEAIEEIKTNSGTQFSPLVVKAFLKAYNKNEL